MMEKSEKLSLESSVSPKMIGPVLIGVTWTALATNDNRCGGEVFKSVCLGATAWLRIPTGSDFPGFFPSSCRGAGHQSPRPQELGMSLISVILIGLILPRHLSLTLITAAPGLQSPPHLCREACSLPPPTQEPPSFSPGLISFCSPSPASEPPGLRLTYSGLASSPWQPSRHLFLQHFLDQSFAKCRVDTQ